MRKFLIVAVVGLSLVSVQAEPELKGSPAELAAYLKPVVKTVNLTGEAEVKLPADRALISLNVVTENKSLQEASRANQDLRGRILKTLTDKGVPADRIKAAKFSSTPKYGIFKEKAKSYRVENIIKITTHDEREFQAVAGIVDTYSEVRYDSIEFEYSNKEELKAKTLAQAIDKANERKRLYEEKLGVKLTARAFSEGRVGPAVKAVQREYYGAKSDGNVTAGLRSTTGVLSEAALVGDVEAPVSFDELVFTAQVIIEYAVESK